ncbi:MAG: 2-isopropylmalate synthase [Proteobacteria bacterium]|nr:2-isopropylmalate synthase [Pseudomonadota bacterium]
MATRPRSLESTRPNHHRKYRPFEDADWPGRRWPGRRIERAPQWCSVDLRDGNQALREPMGPERKLRLFEELVRVGFKQIEVGFPAASETEFVFLRRLIDEDRVPDDVAIQVLTQARDDLIDRTFEALRGARRAIVHLYNSTSELQRRVVFGRDRAGIVEIAVAGARRVRARAERLGGTEVVYQYSPESFTGTELDFALEICEAVLDVWEPSAAEPAILNLPATVEMSTPNVYADRIEAFGERIARREAVVLSVHPHNDRGTAVAAAELAQMAGAQRVEGTLFGNGERTGNVDVCTLALNLLTQGVDPELDLSDLTHVARIAEECTGLGIHPRHPYAGELVHTAFSGSHQDAIRKGLREQERRGDGRWEVPYLPIDPADIGCSYEAVIRVNSQSGKGGVAYLIERDRELDLPRALQVEFGRGVQARADASGRELSSDEIWNLFQAEYLDGRGPLALLEHRTSPCEGRPGVYRTEARVSLDGDEIAVAGEGNGPVAAFMDGLSGLMVGSAEVAHYSEHSLGTGDRASAAAYVELHCPGGGSRFGVGIDANIVTACLSAVVGAVNRLHRGQAGVRVLPRAAIVSQLDERRRESDAPQVRL